MRRDPLRPARAAALILIAVLTGCAELSDDPLPPSGPAARVHPEGWTVADSDEHHSKAVAAAGWDLTECQSCHGVDYTGAGTQVSCFTCHDAGPEGCDVCHGGNGRINPPQDLSGSSDPAARGVGAHETHLQTNLTVPLDCSVCHTMPSEFSDPGHIDGDGRAEILFGERALRLDSTPLYDGRAISCSNTYCHSGGRFGLNPTMIWHEPDRDQAACGTCHALPPGPETDHLQVAGVPCSTCHISVVDAEFNIIDASLHMNGQTDF